MNRFACCGFAKTAVVLLILTYLPGCEPTNMDEQYALAEKYVKGDGVIPDNAVAVRWYRAAAEQGHVESQYKLGCLYDKGEGVLTDSAEAIKWFRLAASSEHPASQVLLGVKYLNGDGVSKSHVEAMRYFQAAANASFPQGLMMLGQMYDKGLGVSENNEKAYELYKAAGDQGLDEASKLAVDVYAEIIDDELVETFKTRIKEGEKRINEKYRVMNEPVFGVIGREISCVGMSLYVYQAISQHSGDPRDLPPDGYYRIAVELSIANDLQRDPLSVGPSHFSIEANTGESWNCRGTSPTTTLGFLKLNAGEFTRGWIAFDVPIHFRSGYLVMSLSLAGAPIKVKIP